MKHWLTYGLFLVMTLALKGQGYPSLETAVDSLPLSSVLGQMEKDYELNFYYRQEWVNDVIVSNASEGTSLDRLLNVTLRDVSLSWYREGNDIYIFPGKPVVSKLPSYEKVIEGVPVAAQGEEQAEYLQTKSLSEKNYITVGNKQRAPNGRKSKVYGTITNRITGEPMIGATVMIKRTGTGTISDPDGNFLLELDPGDYTVSVNHMAMKEMTFGLNVLSDGPLDIELENELIELEEVTVSDQRQGNVEGMLMGFERISSKSIKEIPLVLGEKDILKVAQMLPGVQNVGEGASGFNVRGGSADQNMFYINNISVYNTSHLFGFFTAFSPDIISDFSLYKNNIPARYGGRIASFFEINTRQGNKEQFFFQGGLSPITGHLEVEGPVIRDKVSVIASARSTYSDWILKRIDDKDLRESNASFYDGTFGVNAEINPNNTVEFFAYHSSDQFSLSTRNDYAYSNTGASLRWRHRFADHLVSDLSVASSNYQFSNDDNNNPSEAFSHRYSIGHSEARADFLWTKLNNHRVEFGVNSIYYDLDRGEISPLGIESMRIPVLLGQEFGLENSVYLSDEFRLLPRLNVLLGMRYSVYNQLGPADVNSYYSGEPRLTEYIEETVPYGAGEIVATYSGFEPRASMNFALGPMTSIKASYNHLQQYIFLLSNTIAIAPNDQWKLTDMHISPPESDQVSVGFYHDFKDLGINTSLEVYRKWINNVVEYRDGADFISPDPIETQVLQGVQDSKGIEFMVKKNTDNLTGWMSYTYSRSIVLVDDPRPENQVNNGIPYPSNFDRPHSFNLVANYRVSRRISFSGNIVYMTGRPVTLPISTYWSEGERYLLYSERNAYRIPDYFRVDFSFNLEGNLKYKKLAHSFWMLNIYNLTGRKNAYSVFYEAEIDEIQGYKLSIFARPIVTVSWNFKFGNYNSN